MKKLYSLTLLMAFSLVILTANAQDIGIFAPIGLDDQLYNHYESTFGNVDRTTTLSGDFYQDKQLIFYVLGDNTMNDPQNIDLIQEHLSSGGTLVVVADHSNMFADETGYANTLLMELGTDTRFVLAALERSCRSVVRNEATFPVESDLTEGVNLIRYGLISGFAAGTSTTVLINSTNGNPLVAVESMGCGRIIYFTDTNLWRCLAVENDNRLFFTNIYNQSVDDTPPVLSGVPENTTASCDAVPEPAVVTANDLRDGDLEVQYEQTLTEGACANSYQLSRTWTATDCNGNTATAEQIIDVVDDEGPEIIVPEDYKVYAAPGAATAVVNYEGISANDNCGSASIEFDPPSGSELPLGITTVTATATDQCGNQTVEQFDVNVLEVTAKLLKVSGGGFIVVNNSSGEYASDPDSKANFGFNVKYYEQSNTGEGELNFVFRRTEDGSKHVYQAIGESFSSLEITENSLTSATATFEGIVDLYNVSDEDNPVLIASDALIEVSATDNGEPGHNDQIGFTIWDMGTLLYSSDWTGSETTDLTLSGGNIKIHNGGGDSDRMNLTSQMASQINQVLNSDDVEIFPNPSAGIFNLKLPSNVFAESSVQIIVTSIEGKFILSENIFLAPQTEINLLNVRPGIYLLQIIQDENRIIRRLEKR